MEFKFVENNIIEEICEIDAFERFLEDSYQTVMSLPKGPILVKEKISDKALTISSVATKGLTLHALILLDKKICSVYEASHKFERLFSTKDKGWKVVSSEDLYLSFVREVMSRIESFCISKASSLRTYNSYDLGLKETENPFFSEKGVFYYVKTGKLQDEIFDVDFEQDSKFSFSPYQLSLYLDNHVGYIDRFLGRKLAAENNESLARALGKLEGIKFLNARLKNLEFNDQEKQFFSFYNRCKGLKNTVIYKMGELEVEGKNPLSTTPYFNGCVSVAEKLYPINTISDIENKKMSFGFPFKK